MAQPVRKKRKTEDFDLDLLLAECDKYDEMKKLGDSLKEVRKFEEPEEIVNSNMYDSIVYSVTMITDCDVLGFNMTKAEYILYNAHEQQQLLVEIRHKECQWLYHLMDNAKGECWRIIDMNDNLIQEFTENPSFKAIQYMDCLLIYPENYKFIDLSTLYKIYLAYDEYSKCISLIRKYKSTKRNRLFMKYLDNSDFSFEQYADIGYKTSKMIIELKNNQMDIFTPKSVNVEAVPYITKIFWLMLNKPGNLDEFNVFEYLPTLKNKTTLNVNEKNAYTKGLILQYVAFMLLYLGLKRSAFDLKIQRVVNDWHRAITVLMNRYKSQEKYLRLSHLVMNHLLNHIDHQNRLQPTH